jgi:hypothetical protein
LFWRDGFAAVGAGGRQQSWGWKTCGNDSESHAARERYSCIYTSFPVYSASEES